MDCIVTIETTVQLLGSTALLTKFLFTAHKENKKKEPVYRSITEKVDGLIKKDAEKVNKGDYLKFDFGKTSFSQSVPRLRKQAIENRVEHIIESRLLLGTDYNFDKQFD